VSKEKCQGKTESSILTGRKGIASPIIQWQITVSCEVASDIHYKRVFIWRSITAPNTRKNTGNTTKIL